MALEIINKETEFIIQRAIGMDMVRPWPGKTFTLNGDHEGMALLGMLCD